MSVELQMVALVPIPILHTTIPLAPLYLHLDTLSRLQLLDTLVLLHPLCLLLDTLTPLHLNTIPPRLLDTGPAQNRDHQ